MLAKRELTRAGSDHVVPQPACPSCGKILRLTRTTSGLDGQADPRTYGCQVCGFWVMEAAVEPLGHRGGYCGCNSEKRGRSFIVVGPPCLGSPKRECRPPRLGFFTTWKRCTRSTASPRKGAASSLRSLRYTAVGRTASQLKIRKCRLSSSRTASGCRRSSELR